MRKIDEVTRNEFDEIKGKLLKKIKLEDIAREYDISTNAVWRISNNKVDRERFKETSLVIEYVEPACQPKLSGAVGISMRNIAKSLGIFPKHAREKLKTNNYLEFFDKQGWQWAEFSSLSKKSKTEFTEYVLDINAAKFFVAKYNNEIGNSYLAFLLNAEKKSVSAVIDTSAQPYVSAKKITGILFEMADLFGAPRHLVQTEIVKEVKMATGMDFNYLLAAAPAQDKIEGSEVYLEPTEVAKALGIKSATALNRMLAERGYQERCGTQWEATEKAKAKSACFQHHWKKGTKTGYNWKWRISVVGEILKDDTMGTVTRLF